MGTSRTAILWRSLPGGIGCRNATSSCPRWADAWRTTETQLGSWQSIPLPRQADLTYDRYGNDQQVRAFDYNLFAQDMFSNWVPAMAAVIHESGSRQLIDVGQDEGGVTNRLLNQFYATAGVSFTDQSHVLAG